MARSPFFLALALPLAACGTGGAPGEDPGASKARKAAVQTAMLTGLYENEVDGRTNQMCIIDRATGDSRFGIVVWGANLASCSGEGSAVRVGDTLRLTMEGDEACEIEAAVDGLAVAFPARVPQGCSYYCGAAAGFAGTRFEKVGGEPADALRARDLAGDPLCA